MNRLYRNRFRISGRPHNAMPPSNPKRRLDPGSPIADEDGSPSMSVFVAIFAVAALVVALLMTGVLKS